MIALSRYLHRKAHAQAVQAPGTINDVHVRWCSVQGSRWMSHWVKDAPSARKEGAVCHRRTGTNAHRCTTYMLRTPASGGCPATVEYLS